MSSSSTSCSLSSSSAAVRSQSPTKKKKKKQSPAKNEDEVTVKQNKDDVLALKLYTKLQKKNPSTFLFFISRSSDFNLITYNILKFADKKVHDNVAKIEFLEGNVSSPITEVLVKNFFGLNKPVVSAKNKNKFKTSMIAMPKRIFTVEEKNSNKRQVVTCTIDNIKNCVLLGAHMSLTFNKLGIPTLHSIKLTGLNKATQTFVTEVIVVTAEMQQAFNIGKVIKTYMASA